MNACFLYLNNIIFSSYFRYHILFDFIHSKCNHMEYQCIPTTYINLFPLLIKAMPLSHGNIPCYLHTNILSRIDNFQIQWETIFILTIYMQCVGIEATYLCILYFLSIFIRIIYIYIYIRLAII